MRERKRRGSARRTKDDPTAGMTAEQRVHWMVVHRKKDGIEAALDAAGVRENPVRVLNDVLLPAMKEVGDKFGAGELILPFVLQSAEVMKKAVKHLEQFLERAEGYTKGRSCSRRCTATCTTSASRSSTRSSQQRLHGLRSRQAG